MKYRQHNPRFWYSGARDQPLIELVAQQNFRLDIGAAGHFFLGDLPPRFADLLHVAMAVYAADRRVKRGQGRSRPWRRDLTIRVEVFDPGYWGSRAILDDLRSAVDLISGDMWDFEFRKAEIPYEGVHSLFASPQGSESPLICLYSGGLDSAAGLALRLKENADRIVYPLAVRHQPGQQKRINSQVKRLHDCHGTEIRPLAVKAALIRPTGSRWSKEESSQRARSFLFAALGAAAAAASGGDAVEVYESGVGAINVPLMAGVTGAKATRGCLPGFFRIMSRLTSTLADREIHFRLPFDRMTKGEMARELARIGLADLARATISCSSFPLGYRRNQPCGVCAACVYRRQAMMVAGIDERAGTYTFDIFGAAEYVNGIAVDKLKCLKAFCMQVASWRGIEQVGRFRDPVELHLRETKTLGPNESSNHYVNLLARNRDEWMAIAAEGRRRGYRWAEWLNPDARPNGRGASRDAA